MRNRIFYFSKAFKFLILTVNVWSLSSVGQSSGLIIRWSTVQVCEGPQRKPRGDQDLECRGWIAPMQPPAGPSWFSQQLNNKIDPVAQLVEHNTFNVGVTSSSLVRITFEIITNNASVAQWIEQQPLSANKQILALGVH